MPIKSIFFHCICTLFKVLSIRSQPYQKIIETWMLTFWGKIFLRKLTNQVFKIKINNYSPIKILKYGSKVTTLLDSQDLSTLRMLLLLNLPQLFMFLNADSIIYSLQKTTLILVHYYFQNAFCYNKDVTYCCQKIFLTSISGTVKKKPMNFWKISTPITSSKS